ASACPTTSASSEATASCRRTLGACPGIRDVWFGSCVPRFLQLPCSRAVLLRYRFQLFNRVMLRRMRTFQPLDRISAYALDEVSPVRNPHRLGLARVVLGPGVARLALTVTIHLLEPQLRRRPSRSVVPGIPGPAVTFRRVHHTARY